MKKWILVFITSINVFCVGISNLRKTSPLSSDVTSFVFGPSKITPGLSLAKSSISVDKSYRAPQCSPKSRDSPSIVLYDQTLAVPMANTSGSVSRRAILLPNCVTVQLLSLHKLDIGLQAPLSAFLLSVGGGYMGEKPGLVNNNQIFHLNQLRSFSGTANLFQHIASQADSTHTTYVGEVQTHLLRSALSAFVSTFLNDTLLVDDTPTVDKKTTEDVPEYNRDNSGWLGSLIHILRGSDFEAGKLEEVGQVAAVVVSGYDLDYMQRLAETSFGRLPPKTDKLSRVIENNDGSTDASSTANGDKIGQWHGDGPLKACVVPKGDGPMEVRISWPLYFSDTTAAKYANALSPYAYIPLQDKSKGSLYDLLISSGSVNNLRYELEVDAKIAIPTIALDLRSQDPSASDVDSIVAEVFAHLKGLRSQGVPLHYINEVHAKKNDAWEQYNSADSAFMMSMGLSKPGSLAKKLARAMRVLPEELWSEGIGGWGELKANLTTSEDLSLAALKQRFHSAIDLNLGLGLEFTPGSWPEAEVGENAIELINAVLNTMTVDNAVITATSQRCKDLNSTVDLNFGTKYHLEEISGEVLGRWRDEKRTKGVSLPKSNRWLPLQPDTAASFEMHRDSDRSWKVHVGSDLVGEAPIGSVMVELISDEYSNETALNRFKFSVLTSLMHDVCSSGDFYAPTQAGYSCQDTKFTPNTLRFGCTGHSANLTDYALMVFEGVHLLPDIPDHRYQFHIDKIKDGMRFHSHLSEAEQAVRHLDVALDDSIITPDIFEVFSALVTPKRVKMLANNLSILLRDRVIPATSWFERFKSLFWSRPFHPAATIDVNAILPESKTESFVNAVTKQVYPFEGKMEHHPAKQSVYFAIPQKKLVVLRLQSAKKGPPLSAICLKFQIEDSLYDEDGKFAAMLLVLGDALEFETTHYFTGDISNGDLAEMRQTAGNSKRMEPATVNFILHSAVSNPVKLRNHLEAFLQHFESTALAKVSEAGPKTKPHQDEGHSKLFSSEDLLKFWSECFSVAGVRRRAVVSEVWPEGQHEVGMTGSHYRNDEVAIYPSPVLLKDELRAKRSVFGG